MKKQILTVIKAGLSAFIILNVICFFVYNLPQRIEDTSGSTDYKWPSHSFYSKFVEGFSFGFNNNEGFNNTYDFVDGVTKIDGLFMGSSNVEGYQSMPKYNVVNLLNNKTDLLFYNVSISEHKLTNCIFNLQDAINKYKPSKYVVIETMDISFYDNEIEAAQNENLPTYSTPLVDFLQNFKYLKLVRYQFNNFFPKEKTDSVNNKTNIDTMLKYAGGICKEHNLRLIIVFHPHFIINNDNSIDWMYSNEDMNIFEKSCIDNGVIFINMQDSFFNEYINNQDIPYGFSNTKPGFGHLNKVGHKLMAEEIIECIGDLDE